VLTGGAPPPLVAAPVRGAHPVAAPSESASAAATAAATMAPERRELRSPENIDGDPVMAR
jgi:hypothetical protein